MCCPKCGTENPDDAQTCRSCGAQLLQAPMPSGDIVPRTSRLAIAAFVLAVLGPFTLGITVVPAIVLGIISTIIINRSGGRLTGTTLAGAGIVIPAILLLLGGILMPALLKARRTSLRTTCRNNLLGIGKAMVVYANDYEGAFPRAGSANSLWAMAIHDWQASSRFEAYGLAADGSKGDCTISSCFYLLVKYAEVVPKSFVCPGDSGASEFNPAEYNRRDAKLSDLWDFGPDPRKHCSYSYHQPFSMYSLTTSSEPGMAVAADGNPWIESPGTQAKQWPSVFDFRVRKEDARALNAITHEENGQNVLFIDNHVGFEKNPFCGTDDDNIYTFWNGGDTRVGGRPWLGDRTMPASVPTDRLDSFLVHDGHSPIKGPRR